MSKDLKYIKKKYGEGMSKLCREIFPSLLETEGLLSSILTEKFEESRFLYKDLIKNDKVEDFKNYIYSLSDSLPKRKEEFPITETPKELLEKAGYNLYECKSEEDIKKFEKYYREDEALCTFNGGRLERCHVFFAVKKNVDDINRDDFLRPRRQDEYGTSVISIQFTKDDFHTLSIKNRYNHTVENPDSTFSNDLENIIVGLTESFENEYGLVQRNNEGAMFFDMSNYVKGNDSKFYRYNYEYNNIYYGSNNVVIDNFEVKKFPKEKYLLLDCYILDLEHKKIYSYDDTLKDSFIDGLCDMKKISIQKDKNNKKITINPTTGKEISIVANGSNEILEYINENLVEIGDDFLHGNHKLEKLELLNLKRIGHAFLYDNNSMKKLYFPSLEDVGNNFLYRDEALEELITPKLKTAKHAFLSRNEKLSYFSAPKLEDVADYFCCCNKGLSRLEFLNLKKVGEGFFRDNTKIEEVFLPKLEDTGDEFLCENRELKELFLPSLINTKNDFVVYNEKIEKAEMPNLKKTSAAFFYSNKNLKKLEVPSLQEVGDNFLFSNEILEELIAPRLRDIGSGFLQSSKKIKKLEVSNLENYDNKVKESINSSGGRHL